MTEQEKEVIRHERYLRRKEWEKKNPDKAKAIRDRYRAKHPDKIKEYRERYLLNRAIKAGRYTPTDADSSGEVSN